MNRLQEKVLAEVDLAGLVDTLCELIAIPSEGGYETPAQERMAELMATVGLTTDVWSIDFESLRRHPAYTVEIERDQGLGVVGSFGSGKGPTLILNGHIDVVPAGEAARWSVPPWQGTVRQGRVFGRGSVDMKGGLCCALFAVKAVRDAGVKLAGTVVIHSVIGEEDGGAGTLATILRGHTGDAAIIMEPTGLVVAPAQAGALGFRLSIPGRAAHGALRTEGIDPLEKFPALFATLRAFEAERNTAVPEPLFDHLDLPFPLLIGRISGGVWPSTVAETLLCEGRLGVGTHEDPGAVRKAFEACIAKVSSADPWLASHPPTVEWSGAQFEPAVTPADHPVVEALTRAHRQAAGAKTPVQGVPYGADMRLLVNEGGVPTVIYGPGDIRVAHAPDEFVPIEELETATRSLALAIIDYCGVAD